MASAAKRCRYRSRPSRAVQRPSGPWTRLATTRWVCNSGSPSWTSDGRTRSPATRVRTRARGRRGRGGPPGVRPGTRLPPDTSMVGGEHRLSNRRITKAVEDRDALGRPQDHVEPRHRIATMRAAQQLAGVGVATLEHGLEPRRRCFALQPQGGGAGAVPSARGLTVAGQVLLVVGGQLAGVILLPTHPTTWRCRPPRRSPPCLRWRQQRTPGALLSSENGLGRE